MLLVGLRKQGMRCSDCKMNCHTKCQDSVSFVIINRNNLDRQGRTFFKLFCTPNLVFNVIIINFSLFSINMLFQIILLIVSELLYNMYFRGVRQTRRKYRVLREQDSIFYLDVDSAAG